MFWVGPSMCSWERGFPINVTPCAPAAASPAPREVCRGPGSVCQTETWAWEPGAQRLQGGDGLLGPGRGCRWVAGPQWD